MSNSSHKSDFGPALTGLVVGGCVLFALVFGIVVMTSHRYTGEEGAKADSTATSAPAAPTPTTTQAAGNTTPPSQTQPK